MPKITNDFQKLITHIYKTIVENGGTVEESKMLHEKDSGTDREVDILVEFRNIGHLFRVAIECRDHARKQNVEWIDSLIGKMKSLNLDKIIAVSSRGFTKPAIKKAKVNNIECLTLEEATDADWDKFFIRLGVRLFSDPIYIESFARIKNLYFLSAT